MIRINKKSILSLLFFFLLLAGVRALPCYAQDEPIDQLKVFMDEVVLVLQRDEGDCSWTHKKAEIVRIVKTRFDAKELAMRVLATEWKKRSPEEKDNFVDLFIQVLENIYIDKIEMYSDEKIFFVKQIVKDNKALVYSEFVKDNLKIPISYRLKNSDGQWLVYDIIVEGVSLVGNYRKQFTHIIKKEQYSGLVKRMEEKIRESKIKDLEGKKQISGVGVS